MKRREVLKTLLAAPLAGIAGGCAKHLPRHPQRFRVLRIILHGPFAVVQHPNDRGKIIAYVPADPHNLHEFRFQKISEQVPAKTRYQFTLPPKGLRPPERPTYKDRCLDDSTVRIRNWRPAGSYFVRIDLPAPDLMSFAGPLLSVTFKNSKRRGLMPTNQVLEYRIDHLHDIFLDSPELGRQAAATCENFYQGYETYRKEFEEMHRKSLANEAISPHMPRPDWCGDDDLSVFFLGVGLRPDTPGAEKVRHAISFFNEQLLPSLHDEAAIREKSLEAIGDYGNSGAGPGDAPGAARLTAAVWRSSARPPRLLTASYVEDCKAPLVNATNQ